MTRTPTRRYRTDVFRGRCRSKHRTKFQRRRGGRSMEIAISKQGKPCPKMSRFRLNRMARFLETGKADSQIVGVSQSSNTDHRINLEFLAATFLERVDLDGFFSQAAFEFGHFGFAADNERCALVDVSGHGIQHARDAVGGGTVGVFSNVSNRVCLVHHPQFPLRMRVCRRVHENATAQ